MLPAPGAADLAADPSRVRVFALLGGAASPLARLPAGG